MERSRPPGHWHPDDAGRVETFTIITAGPNQLMQPIHYAMIMLEVIPLLFENR